MILNSDFLFQLMHGALWAEKEQYALRPWRFSRKHIQHMADNDVYMVRAAASAGMTLDFETDSTFFSFTLETQPGAGTPWFGLDVMVDQQLFYHAYSKEGTVNTTVRLTLPEGMKRVTVQLPNLCQVCIRDVTLNDGAAVSAVTKKHRILFLGDSITQGYVAEHPSATYSNLLCRALDAECLNQAIGGAVHDADRLDAETDYHPERIFTAYGTNDWNLQHDLTQSAEEWYQKLHFIYGNTPVYVLLPIWRIDCAEKEAAGFEPFLQARSRIKEVCERYPNCRVLDTIDYIPHDPAFYHDHVHPNENGFERYAKAIVHMLNDK